MTDRIPLDHLTSDQYDQLCNDIDRLRADIAGCRAQQWPQRLGAAEKTLNSVRALVDECEARGHGSGYPLTVTRIRAELDEPGPA